MAKILILGNNPRTWWIKDINASEILSVPNISNGRDIDISSFIHSLPKDADCIVIDADSLDHSNIELPLELILQIRLMLYECRGSSLSNITIVSDLNFETYRDYGSKSMVLMTKNISFVKSADAQSVIENARPMTPSEYVSGFLKLIKIEPAEKVEGRHSIANEWGVEALFNVISGGVKENIISLKASSSLYFKYSNVVALNAEDVGQIIEGKMNRYLTQKVTIANRIKYLLIDDEAAKGWSQVLASLMPNAVQEVWDSQIDSYEGISIDVRHKIESGEYDLIFLDLRMAGVKEDSILKPDEFSGIKILKAIKIINPGIQVIMLTATNKAWNLKAFMDAGANGYYMKESPEYHFSLNYSKQNAESFVNTIKGCIANSYLKDIIAQCNALELPSESELSDNIYNQLAIACSLILKAHTEPEYAFAYISLEQIFEIASSFLIEQKTENKSPKYFFTEDSQDRCRLFINGKDTKRYLDDSKDKGNVAQWKKIAAIYYQLYDGKDSNFGEKVQRLIQKRNDYIHPNGGVKPNITSDDFQELFGTIKEFLYVFK